MKTLGRVLNAWLCLSILFLIGCQDKQNFGLQDQTDKFGGTVFTNNKVDVLLVVDNSKSMGQHQENLANQVDALVTSLNQTGLEYNIAVMSTDIRSPNMGGQNAEYLGSPQVLKNSTANLKNLLKNRIKLGQNGSDVERGLEGLLKALNPDYYKDKKFIRSDALLAIIVLSDEDDQSTTSTASVKEHLDKIKPPYVDGTKGWVLNFIGVHELEGACTTFGPHRSVGTKYMELSQYSGGSISTICTADLGQAVSNLKIRIVEILTDFRLSMVPNVGTIQVWIDGIQIPRSSINGWDYIEDKNLIRFYGEYVPQAGESIRVDFTPLEAGG